MDYLNPWLWVPAAIVLWSLLLFPVARSHADDVDPDDLTRLDMLDRGWMANVER